MSAYWTSFGRSQNPNGGQRPNWPAYDPIKGDIMDFTNDGPIAVQEPRREAMKVLGDLTDGGH